MLADAEIEAQLPNLYRRLRSYVRGRVHPDKLEDVLQETVLAVIQMRGRLSSGTLLWPLACTIARRVAGRPGRRPIEPLGDQEPSDSSPGPSTDAALREECRCVRAAVERLDPLKRSILRLRFEEGVPFFRIHLVLGLPSTVVRGQYYMAIDRLGWALVNRAPNFQPVPTARPRPDQHGTIKASPELRIRPRIDAAGRGRLTGRSTARARDSAANARASG